MGQLGLRQTLALFSSATDASPFLRSLAPVNRALRRAEDRLEQDLDTVRDQRLDRSHGNRVAGTLVTADHRTSGPPNGFPVARLASSRTAPLLALLCEDAGDGSWSMRMLERNPSLRAMPVIPKPQR